jgi:hypothetical protein
MSASLSRYTEVEDRVLWMRYYALRRAVGDAPESASTYRLVDRVDRRLLPSVQLYGIVRNITTLRSGHGKGCFCR